MVNAWDRLAEICDQLVSKASTPAEESMDSSAGGRAAVSGGLTD